MKTAPSFKEDHISQIPALQVLINLGYDYLIPKEALELRNYRKSNVILETVLEQQLQKINSFEFKGSTHHFSDENVSQAIRFLKDLPFDSLVRTSEQIYELFSLGKSFPEKIKGDTKSFNLFYIDWDNPQNNVFHVTEEFEVESSDGRHYRRPDIVLFVNGIPFAIIECKRPTISLSEAISQQIRNQKNEEIPRLFLFTQLLLVVNKNEGKYGTTSTKMKFWTEWQEKEFKPEEIERIVNTPLSEIVKDKLFSTRFKYVRDCFDELEASQRLITEQDKVLYSLCNPERLLEITKYYILYKTGYKIICWHQQYFAVKNILNRVKFFDNTNRRKGGVIWHTQGSGKSLIMVFLAKALVLDKSIPNPRVFVVTDRINLDKQISKTFKHCGIKPKRATSGKDLLNILNSEHDPVITSVINKFNSAASYDHVNKLEDSDIFVLVDESHRTQYGTMHAMMRRLLPNACYIGFTGTPLMKKDKNTAFTFGGYIDVYTINDAVKDKVIVPLLYEGRHALRDVDKGSIDLWFERHTASLSNDQVVDLKKKFSRIEKLNAADQVIYKIAGDISIHYDRNWKGTGFKAQLATNLKKSALKFKKYFDELGLVTSEVIISAPDDREGEEDIYEDSTHEVKIFWKNMMNRFGNDEEKYNEELIDSFTHADHPELLIVVDKLLTGFDAPRNTILYIFKSMKEHTLLQAIARVNRLYEGKDFGYIIDYYGLLGELDSALTTYSALKEFDESDVAGILTSVVEEVKNLPQYYSEIWDIFKEIKSKYDEEAYEQHLADVVLRQEFYEKLSIYSRVLGIALSTTRFYDDYSMEQIKKFKRDLAFFQELRRSVKKRYAEVVDFKEYERKIQNLLDKHISSHQVEPITDLVNIFSKEEFEKEVERVTNKASRADMIAHRTMRSIQEKYEEDPVFYRKFSELIQQAIDEYRAQRISEVEYFNRVKEYMERVHDKRDESIPKIIIDKMEARAFYGVVTETISENNEESAELKENIAKIGLEIDKMIREKVVVDWQRRENIQNQMINAIDDYLIDRKTELSLSMDDIDKILEKIIKIAKRWYAR